MRNFEYSARDENGIRRTGLQQAESEQDILHWLREQGMTPIQVKVIGSAKKEKKILGRNRIKSEEMAGFCWQLCTMVEGGVPITEGIRTIGDDIENPFFRQVLTQIYEKMKTGETFSDALVAFPKVFNPLFCAMILAGETGGTLPMVLQRLAQYFDNRDALVRKIKGAMAYPVFVLIFVILMVVVIMTFIIPRFTVIFDQLHGKLPFFTQAFMTVYHGVMGSAIYILLGLGLATAGFVCYFKTARGHERICQYLLKLPFIGKILSQGFISIFCRTMSTLLSAGVSVIDALGILSGMTSNDIIKRAVQSTKGYIIEGSNISLSMAASGFFPSMVTKMAQIGEGSGSLPEVLDRTSDFYEKKVDVVIKKLTGFLEPALIITVGAIVLVVVLALYMPIFTMSDVSMQ